MTIISSMTHAYEDSLRARAQWLVWILEEKSDGKLTKVPYNARTGKPASTIDPLAWSTFENAMQALSTDKSADGRSYTGLGYVFNQDETGIDLDHCIDTHGRIDPWAQKHIDRFASYTERSYSGTGIHILVKGTIPGKKGIKRKVRDQRDPNAAIEIYSQGRYFVMTGDRIVGTAEHVQERQAELDALCAKLNPPKDKAKPARGITPLLNDGQILDKALDAKNGSKFRSLFMHGETSGYISASEADLALCSMLAFWSGKDPHTIDRLFRRSALYRDKWDERHGASTYGDMTIAAALERCQETYTGFEPMKVEASQVAKNGNGNGHHDVKAEITDENLCEFTADDAGNGDALLALHGQDFLWCAARGWFRYTGTHWELDLDGAEVRRRAVETLRRRRHAAIDEEQESIVKCTKGDESRVNGAINRFKTLVNTSIDEFDTDPDLLNCKNGIVDLRTGSIEQHARSQRFTYCVPVAYEESDYSEWVAYLVSVVGGGQEVIDYLQTAVGYSFTGHTREEIMFYLYGPTRSGKGGFGEAFMSLLPTPISKGVDFMSFTAKRDGDVSNFDLAPLKPARMIFASESNKSQALNPAKIKQLTGGDQISCCYKHKDFFSYRPQFKVWMMSNHQVNGDPEDDALWGRVRVIEFPHSFLGMEDKTKKARLRHPDVQKGILYWSVQGAIKWYQLGAKGLSTPEAVAKTTKAHRDELDYVQQWLDECCDDDEESWTPNDAVSTSYLKWCDDNNVQHPKGLVALNHSLKAKGYAVATQKKINGVNTKGVKGLHIFGE